jgi:superfamily II DNA helicase RecQ
MSAIKICTKCRKGKALKYFYADKQKSCGKRPRCIECEKEKTKTPEYKKRRSHPKYDAIRRKHKLKTYGLTVEQYKEMFDKQLGKCAICRVHQIELPKELSVDHSHVTGKVRGLLCSNCNFGLGYFKDSIERLQEAVTYLVHNG